MRFLKGKLMKTAKEKMIGGEDYFINDPELVEIRYKTRELVDKFNATGPRDVQEKNRIQKELFGSLGESVHIEKPIRIDYGFNTVMGNNVFINYNFTLLDCAKVTIGNNVFIAPNVSVYTAKHPIDIAERAAHIGSAEPINIGSDVWIGGNCIILPGVTIGDGCTIGAGSIVSKDIPPHTIAVGSPCKVVKHLKPH